MYIIRVQRVGLVTVLQERLQYLPFAVVTHIAHTHVLNVDKMLISGHGQNSRAHTH